MTAFAPQHSELRRIWDDPWEFMCRLLIKDRMNQEHRLNSPWPEQAHWIRALLGDKKYVLGLKPRQLGFTTFSTAYLFWRSYTSAHPRLELQVVHDPASRVRVRDMVDTFRMGLPAFWQSGYRKGFDNHDSSIFEHNQGGFQRRIAGAKGKARSWTFNDMHATEMAHWSSATSAGRRDAAGSDDETMFSSAMATMHDPAGRVIVESTGNGPHGLFFDLCRQAREDPAWAYVFVPWNAVERYRMDLDREASFNLAQELTPQELELMAEPFSLTLEQVAWRRNKIRTERWSELRFRREFPLTDMEPFLLAESGWFDQLTLSKLLRHVPELGSSDEPFRQFREPEKGMAYFMGVDTAGGVGRDSSVIQIVDIHLRHCAVWASNRASVPEQAQMVSRLGNLYNRPVCVIEANNFGERVISRVGDLGGVQLWKNDDDDDFWTTGGRAGQTKREVMVHARQMIEDQWTTIVCARTIHEAQSVVEKDNGKIEAAGDGHDDHIMAFVFALWAARRAGRRDRTAVESDRDKLKRTREAFGGSKPR